MVRCGQGLGRRQLRVPHRPIGHKLQETDIAPYIAPVVQQHCNRGFAVSAGPSEFLQIVLNRGRMLPMNDHTNIIDVESHAESARADDPIYLRPTFPGKPLEELLPLPGVAELRMIERRLQSLFAE